MYLIAFVDILHDFTTITLTVNKAEGDGNAGRAKEVGLMLEGRY